MSGILLGRLAFVTGAGSGIGRATCDILSKEGATVIAADKNFAAAKTTIEKYMKPSNSSNSVSKHCAIEMDVSKLFSVNNALQSVMEQYKKPPCIVVNAAGIASSNFFLDLKENDYDSVTAVNLKGTYLVTQIFAQAIVAASIPGSIINISSIVGVYGGKGITHYASTKAGVIGLSKSAAKELGGTNVRVNAVLPGYIITPMTDTLPDEVRETMIKLIALGRLGEPAEIAEVIAFLASDKSSYITGATIEVSGGY